MQPDRIPAVLDSAAHYNLTTFIRENQLSRRIADLPHLCGRRERENGGIHPPASMQIILAVHRHGGVFQSFSGHTDGQNVSNEYNRAVAFNAAARFL